MPWRPPDGGQLTFEALIRGLFQPAALLDYLRSCVVFEQDERGHIAKKIAGYHQFRAVRQTRALVLADLRRKVRRLLALYGYPPDLSEDATQLVLRQAELSTSAD